MGGWDLCIYRGPQPCNQGTCSHILKPLSLRASYNLLLKGRALRQSSVQCRFLAQVYAGTSRSLSLVVWTTCSTAANTANYNLTAKCHTRQRVTAQRLQHTPAAQSRIQQLRGAQPHMQRTAAPGSKTAFAPNSPATIYVAQRLSSRCFGLFTLQSHPAPHSTKV